MGSSSIGDAVDMMGGHEFNDYCAELLRLNGYEDVQVTKKSGDNGADIICKKYGKKYAVQCKRQKDNVGFKALQEIFTAKTIYDCDVAVVMTNSKFTKSAHENAKTLNIKLWGNKKLSKLQEIAVASKALIPDRIATIDGISVVCDLPLDSKTHSASKLDEVKLSNGCVIAFIITSIMVVVAFGIGLFHIIDNITLPNFISNFIVVLPNIPRFLLDNIAVVIGWGLFFVYGWVKRKWSVVIIITFLSLIALYIGLWT